MAIALCDGSAQNSQIPLGEWKRREDKEYPQLQHQHPRGLEPYRHVCNAHRYRKDPIKSDVSGMIGEYFMQLTIVNSLVAYASNFGNGGLLHLELH